MKDSLYRSLECSVVFVKLQNYPVNPTDEWLSMYFGHRFDELK